MTESAAPSAGTESGSSEVASTGSTSTPSSVPTSQPSGNPVGDVKGAQASQVVDAIENAEQTSPGMFEVVIDGERVTLTVEELKAGYQKAKSSAKRFQEASEKMKQAEAREAAAEERKKQLLKNPLKAMYEEGLDEKAVRAHYEEAVWQWLQQDQMTPEQKAAIQKQREHETEKQQLAREKAEIETWKKERQAEKERLEVEKYQNDFAAQLSTALTKHQLPNNPSVVSKLIEYMKDGLSFDDTYTFDDAVQVYKEEHQQDFKKYLSSLSPAELMAAIGPEGVKAFRKQDVETNVKLPTSAKPKSAPAPTKSKDNKISSKDFFANLGK